MRAAALLVACAALLAPRAHAADDDGSSPLLDLARETLETPDPDSAPVQGDRPVRYLQHEMTQARVPADADCGRGLGASRFAELHDRMGSARMRLGEPDGAAASFRSAHACRPRSSVYLGHLAGALFAQRDYGGARAAIEEGLAVDPRSMDLHRQLGYLDFVAGRWADATARFRYVATGDLARQRAAFAELMYWLAQRRAGVAKPLSVERAHDDTWPRPLISHLAGESSETNLVHAIDSDHFAKDDVPEYGESRTEEQRTRLCQALFYVGEMHWAGGDNALARQYLAMAINMRMAELPEHQLAIAEISKLRE